MLQIANKSCNAASAAAIAASRQRSLLQSAGRYTQIAPSVKTITGAPARTTSSDRGSRAASVLLILSAHAARLQRFAQQIFDLSVDAPQFRARQARDRGVERWIEAKRERLSVNGHSRALLVDGAGVDHGLGVAIGAEHHEQVRHHRRAAFVVELDDVAL